MAVDTGVVAEPPALTATALGDHIPRPGRSHYGRRPPLDPAAPPVMAIANQKGGVGKTTTAVNLGAGLAELGYRVLVVDLDPQGNATTGLGINARNLADVDVRRAPRRVPLEDCVEPTAVRNLFVAPATIDLAGAEIELVPGLQPGAAPAPGARARSATTTTSCSSTARRRSGLLTVNGLAAATEVMVPIQCEYYALEGLGQLLRNVELVQRNLNPALELSAHHPGHVRRPHQAGRPGGQRGAASTSATKVCRNIVPRTVRLSEAPSFGQPIIAFDPTSRGAMAYRELAKEVSGGAPQRTG